eukprot:11757_1
MKKNKNIPCVLKVFGKQKVTKVAVGWGHSLILTQDGNVWSTGRNHYGQLGHNNTTNISTAKIIEDITHENITSIACGNNHSCVMNDNNEIFSFGANNNGECGIGENMGYKIKTP